MHCVQHLSFLLMRLMPSRARPIVTRLSPCQPVIRSMRHRVSAFDSHETIALPEISPPRRTVECFESVLPPRREMIGPRLDLTAQPRHHDSEMTTPFEETHNRAEACRTCPEVVVCVDAYDRVEGTVRKPELRGVAVHRSRLRSKGPLLRRERQTLEQGR